MQSLHDLLASERETIVAEFARRVRLDRLLPESMPEQEVVDSLPAFLDEVARCLADAKDITAMEDLARAHAIHRLRLGFTVREVVREYGLLREIVFVVAQRNGISVEGFAAFARITGAAIEAAVEEYTALREQHSRAQTEKHFAFIAHELRNPITSVRLALERLRRNAQRVSMPSLAPGARPSLAILLGDDAYETVERGIRRLQDLVDNSLVQVKLNSLTAAESLARERVEVREIADEVVADVRGDAADKGITLTSSVEDGLCVLADRRILYSALSNLTRNAVKFSPPNTAVEIRGTAIEEQILLEVEDRCGGLPRQAMDKLFDPFVQVGADRSGFGLGLAITRHAAEAHGGTVTVRNVPERGCVFALLLPRAPRGSAG